MVVPLSVSLTATFNLAMNFITVFIFAIANGVQPKVSWLELIPIALCFIVLATGIGMLLSAAYVRARDVAPIWDVLVQAWFYCTPIMYTASKYASASAVHKFGSNLVHIAMINPAAMLMTQMGHAFIGGPAFPSAPTVGGWPATIAAGAIIVVMFVIGWWFFTREAPRVAENL
jgi:ABC-2 type transport system permease protein